MNFYIFCQRLVLCEAPYSAFRALDQLLYYYSTCTLLPDRNCRCYMFNISHYMYMVNESCLQWPKQVPWSLPLFWSSNPDNYVQIYVMKDGLLSELQKLFSMKVYIYKLHCLFVHYTVLSYILCLKISVWHKAKEI